MVIAGSPWVAGGLLVRRAALLGVEEDAIVGYGRDEEACGYLCGPAAEPLVCDEHVRMENIANKLHAADPERYFRTARTFFDFNGKRFADAFERGVRSGRPIKVVYHSHLDAGATFSPTDAAMMSGGEPPAFEGGPITMGPGPAWPLAFLVTSVRGAAGGSGPRASTGGAPFIDEHRLFVWDGASFAASAFTVID